MPKAEPLVPDPSSFSYKMLFRQYTLDLGHILAELFEAGNKTLNSEHQKLCWFTCLKCVNLSTGFMYTVPLYTLHLPRYWNSHLLVFFFSVVSTVCDIILVFEHSFVVG